jgi:hypothetical protein
MIGFWFWSIWKYMNEMDCNTENWIQFIQSNDLLGISESNLLIFDWNLEYNLQIFLFCETGELYSEKIFCQKSMVCKNKEWHQSGGFL